MVLEELGESGGLVKKNIRPSVAVAFAEDPEVGVTDGVPARGLGGGVDGDHSSDVELSC